MRFSKYHGTGNDFVMVEDLAGSLELSPALIAALCDRHRGVGADGLIRIVRGDGADFFMDYHNADGEVAEMCGNGIRCVAKYVYDYGINRSESLRIQTGRGILNVDVELKAGKVERAQRLRLLQPQRHRRHEPRVPSRERSAARVRTGSVRGPFPAGLAVDRPASRGARSAAPVAASDAG